MTQSKQPPDPPTEGKPADTNPSGTAPDGVPDGMDTQEPKGQPNSDRHKSETAR